jgi:hypothetical protein
MCKDNLQAKDGGRRTKTIKDTDSNGNKQQDTCM